MCYSKWGNYAISMLYQMLVLFMYFQRALIPSSLNINVLSWPFGSPPDAVDTLWPQEDTLGFNILGWEKKIE